MGERIVDRMEFEELALKTIDPSLGPTITHPRTSEMDSERQQEKEKAQDGMDTGSTNIVRVCFLPKPPFYHVFARLNKLLPLH